VDEKGWFDPRCEQSMLIIDAGSCVCEEYGLVLFPLN